MEMTKYPSRHVPATICLALPKHISSLFGTLRGSK
jgi:hypothetical protein